MHITLATNMKKTLTIGVKCSDKKAGYIDINIPHMPSTDDEVEQFIKRFVKPNVSILERSLEKEGFLADEKTVYEFHHKWKTARATKNDFAKAVNWLSEKK